VPPLPITTTGRMSMASTAQLVAAVGGKQGELVQVLWGVEEGQWYVVL